MELIEAVNRNDVESVKSIIAGGGGVDLNNTVRGGWTALHTASRDGFVECVKILLEAKGDIQGADMNRFTPLLSAVWNQRLECVKVFGFVDVCAVRMPKFCSSSSFHKGPTSMPVLAVVIHPCTLQRRVGVLPAWRYV
jgi:Ankyrin repeats (3 copies)